MDNLVMRKTTVDQDAIDFMKTLIFGSVADPLAAAAFRAYRDFNRTLRLGGLDESARVQIRHEATEQLRTCVDVLKRHWTRSQAQYDVWHERTCYDVRGIYLDYGVPFTFGQAQKWVNMTLKYLYVLGDQGLGGFLDYLHVPLDNYVFDIAKRDLRIPRPKRRWSRWDDYTNEYMKYQLALRERITGCSPFRWEIAAWNAEAGK